MDTEAHTEVQVKRSHVKMEAEIAGMQLPHKECQECQKLLGAQKGKEGSLPGTFKDACPCQHLDFTL